MVNKSTGQEYQYERSVKGYKSNGMIIEERYVFEYPNNIETTQDKWKICPEGEDSFRIRCASSGCFLRAKSQYDQNIILGNFLISVLLLRFVPITVFP